MRKPGAAGCFGVRRSVRFHEGLSVGFGASGQVEIGETARFSHVSVNFRAALAEAAQIEKGEEMEWLVEDRNTFVLRRVAPKKPVVK